MAMMFATIAFSIDAIMPALPEIARDLGLNTTAEAAYVMTAFAAGMGLGTFVMGPLSDAWGRKALVYGGLAIYAIGAALSWVAPTLELMLAARVLQGIGASGPRVVSMAIIRDLYAGRQMASIMSLTMMVFLLVPGVAPLLGDIIAQHLGWRAIYGAFLAFSVVLLIWFGIRLRETLPHAQRRPLNLRLMGDAVVEMLPHPMVRLSIVVQSLMLTLLFSVLTMVQPIFDVSFGRADTLPLWFGAIALLSGTASLLNARLVLRFGMRRLITWALYAQLILSCAFAAFLLADLPGVFAFYVVWQFGVMFQGGLTVANLNAIAMEPMGHIAGMAASVIGAISTVVAAVAASLLAHLFDGTPLPLVEISVGITLIALILMQMMRRAEAALA